MKLAAMHNVFDTMADRQRVKDIEAADRQNHKKGQDVEIGKAKLILTDATTGVRYDLFIDGGALLAQQSGVVDATITIVARLT